MNGDFVGVIPEDVGPHEKAKFVFVETIKVPLLSEDGKRIGEATLTQMDNGLRVEGKFDMTAEGQEAMQKALKDMFSKSSVGFLFGDSDKGVVK